MYQKNKMLMKSASETLRFALVVDSLETLALQDIWK